MTLSTSSRPVLYPHTRTTNPTPSKPPPKIADAVRTTNQPIIITTTTRNTIKTQSMYLVLPLTPLRAANTLLAYPSSRLRISRPRRVGDPGPAPDPPPGTPPRDEDEVPETTPTTPLFGEVCDDLSRWARSECESSRETGALEQYFATNKRKSERNAPHACRQLRGAEGMRGSGGWMAGGFGWIFFDAMHGGGG